LAGVGLQSSGKNGYLDKKINLFQPSKKTFKGKLSNETISPSVKI